MSQLRQIPLSPAEEEAWMKSRTIMSWTVPAFQHIFYSMLDNAESKDIAFFTEDVPVAATDGINLILNPKTFFKYNLLERVFIVCHEIMHCVYDHPRIFAMYAKAGVVKYADGTVLPYNDEIMQISADLHINDLLCKSGVGKYNADWLRDQNYTSNVAVIDIYRKLFRHTPPNGDSGGGGDGNGRFDKVLPPNVTSPSKPAKTKAEWQTAIAAAAHLAKEQSKNATRNQALQALGLAREFEKLNEPVVTWDEKLHALFVRKVGSGTYDWRRPDRRFITRGIYTPARAKFTAGDIVVACDTSGSMSRKEISMCFSEIAGILEQITPHRIFVLWCDAYVHRVDEMEDIDDLHRVRKKDAPGGGDTDFRPVFHWIKEKCDSMPDALVFFTDGYGTFPKEIPHFPVIWGNITLGKKYPFGDVVDIPMGRYNRK